MDKNNEVTMLTEDIKEENLNIRFKSQTVAPADKTIEVLEIKTNKVCFYSRARRQKSLRRFLLRVLIEEIPLRIEKLPELVYPHDTLESGYILRLLSALRKKAMLIVNIEEKINI